METLEKFLAIRSFVNGVERRNLVYGASFSEFVILRAIGAEGDSGIRRVELAEKVGLTISGITRALAPLEKLGYVERLGEVLDARVRSVRLSTSGANLYEDILKDVQERMTQAQVELDIMLAAVSRG